MESSATPFADAAIAALQQAAPDLFDFWDIFDEAEDDGLAKLKLKVEKAILAAQTRPEDEKGAIQQLGERIGYGRMMQLAEECWRELLASQGPSGGEFVVGPCRAALDRRGLEDCNELLERFDALLVGGA